MGREVDLLSSPERRFSLLVHLPNIVVLDGEEDKAMRICLEERFESKMAFNHGGLVL